ncbi:MAG: nuclease-related domain-containing protein [Acidimicrobiales bacterium]
MASAEPPPPGPRLMSLRYKGTCEACGAALEARTKAWYDPARRKARCSVCRPAGGDPGPAPCATSPVQHQPLSTAPPPPHAGHAGASALRKYERLSERHHERAKAEVARDAAWRDQVKQAHPVLGRLASALEPKPTIGPEPQSVTAWQTGAHGEVRVGGALDAWAPTVGAVVLHDRKLPGSRANLDHLVIARSGVWSIDAKEYKGPVAKVDVGGWSRTDLRLKVAGRDRTKLLDGLQWQMGRVSEVLERLAPAQAVAVWGALCFVGSDWPVFRPRPLVFGAMAVVWPSGLPEVLSTLRPPTAFPLSETATLLARAFPPA